ncbi:MAG: glutamate--cysteine ligase, partial [Eggerthellaceae bacterium]|nr:glutamate--cysteine ligase [Eggerthellaceae bacterium]
TMFFDDVRLKTYIEIRPADAMPLPFVIAYTALIKGLFYDAENLDALDGMFAGVDEQAVLEAKTDLMARGYEASVYGRPVAEIADKLMELAESSLGKNERPFLVPLADLVSRRKTLADLAEKR